MEHKFGWHDIDWKVIERKVLHRQVRIGVAQKNKDLRKVAQQQDNLTRSWEARALAVRTVTTNKGKNTPGIDGIIWDTPKAKFEAIPQLLVDNNKYKCNKVKRVYIQKANGGLRPLGIPCILDRRLQILWKFALDPIREWNGDRHSYGFRKGRSTKDAMTMLHLLFGSKYRPMWRMDADIKGFFDNIPHSWILENIPINKSILKRWLEAGALDLMKNEEISINAGVPQGGPISPTIANMVLDGLERHVKDRVEPLRNNPRVKGHRKQFSPKVNVVRYRDDFIVTAATRPILINYVKPRVENFLSAKGLELNQTKTYIVSVKEGFDFLGFNFRIYKYSGKWRTTGFIALTKPRKKRIHRLIGKIKGAVNTHKDAGTLVMLLNPIQRGWANYYRNATAKRTFRYIGWYVWRKLQRWATKKSPNLTVFEAMKKCFKRVEGRKSVFFGKVGEKELLLYDIRNTPIRRHTIISDRNPYNPEHFEYFAKRRMKGAKDFYAWDKRLLKFAKKQKFKCPACDGLLEPTHEIDLHHIKPKKLLGSDVESNLVALHRFCHVQVTHAKNPILLARFRKKGIVTR